MSGRTAGGIYSAAAWILRALAIFVIAAFGLDSRAAMAQSAFYRASPYEITGKPGTLIRQQPLDLPAPLSASAIRVLYRSTGLNGEPIAVSGAILIPKGPAPPGGWPIVAWAHPTTGVVPRCAPSLAMFLIQQIQGSREMMRPEWRFTRSIEPRSRIPQSRSTALEVECGSACTLCA
jgi:hypothetical protein